MPETVSPKAAGAQTYLGVRIAMGPVTGGLMGCPAGRRGVRLEYLSRRVNHPRVALPTVWRATELAPVSRSLMWVNEPTKIFVARHERTRTTTVLTADEAATWSRRSSSPPAPG
jgi:hypothetical protein